MKVALVTDTHFGARNDNQVIQAHVNQFFGEVFFPYLEEHNIKDVVHLGDLLDKRKTVSFLTLNNLRKNFMNRLYDNTIMTHILVGNHDSYYKNTLKLNSVSELYGNTPFVHVYDTAETITLGDLRVCLFPWLCPENEYDSHVELDKTDAKILMGHLELVGFLMFKGMRSEHGLKKTDFAKFGQVLSGHFHLRNDDGHIYYLGTPYELMWSDYNTERGFHIFDTDTQELEFIQNPNILFHKIYYKEDMDIDFLAYGNKFVRLVVSEKKNPYVFDTFVDELYAVNPAQLSIVEDFDTIEDETKIEGTEDTITIISNHVANLSTDLDKIRLDKMLRDLYLEAISIE